MLRVMTAVLAFAASVGIALAAGADAIKERRELTNANGEASKPLVPMMKGAAPFDLPTVQKALMAPRECRGQDARSLPVRQQDGRHQRLARNLGRQK
jgi:cytochrome c556